MIYPLLRSALFRLDAEAAHELAIRQMERLQEIPAALRLVERLFAERAGGAPRSLWGLYFRNPLGIAAGFDKNASLVPFLRALGFGFVEVGTVTLRPQPGNPSPRLFRYPSSGALINRLGFNNEGCAAVAERLQQLRASDEALAKQAARTGAQSAPILSSSAPEPPLFANIGKNRDVPLEDAPATYAAVYARLAPLAHGAVINVSSPNTPGLRDLQGPTQIAEILERCRSERERLEFRTGGDHPILVKIAPDLTEEQLAELVAVCLRLADGIVATNTTTGREGLREPSTEAGGLSGRPLFGPSTDVLRRVRALAGPGYPLIGVGGVFTPEDVMSKIAAGADLVQVYTGFIYRGPGFPREVARALREQKR